ncbi:pneumococcal-type histidine triad protein [Facklamia sp. 7083-14-GEN3]|uniref:pneumococcal-type histidine triad protein n=1 Tax=Facklamia sp. 7083-14-GEN3 TaxID=2973478 RepID=UPI00215BDD52|nr:pneumococcal-type histidine triad protein [Facklamia sp. 7083-14-GEN3]MCR8968422.1 pneumococcal-type histidine triad protein [Facklamia sp. 7083-14-GEN3]
MKPSKLLLSSAALLTLLSLNGPIKPINAQETKDSAINYIEGSKDEEQSNHSSTENRTMEEISMEEGIAGEQIIVQINSEGYVTSHGDHYHYFNGEVPSDAIFSEAVLAPEDYQLNDEDFVSQTDEGQIVLIDDQYYLYLENPDQAKNLRSLEEVLLQSYSIDPVDAKAIYDLMEEYDLGEDAIITYELERTPQEVAEQKGIEGEHVVVYLTEEEFVTNHAFDLHVFYGDVDPEAVFSERLLTPEDYQLNQEDVVAEIKNGYIVKLEDKYQVYIAPEDRSQADNIRTFQDIEDQVISSQKVFKQAGGVRKDVANTVAAGEVCGSGSRNSSGAYVTDDGYVFSPYDVIQDLGNGFIVPHGDHFHFIPKSDLTPQELAIAQSVLSAGKHAQANNKKDDKGNHDHIIHDKPNDHEGPYTTDDGYVFSVGSITKVTDTGLIAAHGSHFHFVPFAHLNKGELAQTQAYIQKKFGIKRNLLAEFGFVNEDNKVKKPKDKEASQSDDKIPDKSTGNDQGNRDEIKSEYQRLLAKLYALPANQRHTESDGLVFDPELVTDEIDGDFVLPHGDHFHVIPRSSLSDLEIKLAEMKLGKRPSVDVKPKDPEVDKPAKDDNEKPAKPDQPSLPDKSSQPDQPKADGKVDFLAQNYKKSAKGMDGKPYTTDDGYVFTPESILNYSEKGITAEHEGHTHFIPFADLDDSELKAAADFINQRNIKEAEESNYTEEEIAAKLAYISLENGVAIEDLEVNGNEVIIPHGNHSHTANMDKIPTELKQSNFTSKEDYQTKLITLKMSEVSRNKKYIDVWRKDATIYALTKDYKVVELPLDEVELPIKYDQVLLKDVKTADDPLFEKKVYVAQRYKVKPSDMFIFNGRIKVGDLNLVIDAIDVTEAYETNSNDSPETEEKVDEESANEEVSHQSVIEYIKNYYGKAAKSVKYGKGFGYIVTPASGAENVLIIESEARAAMEKKEALPELAGKADEKEPEAEGSSNNAPSQEISMEELKNFVGNYYGVNPSSLQIFAGMVIVPNPNPDFANLNLTIEQVKLAYQTNGELPVMPQVDPFAEEEIGEGNEYNLDDAEIANQ